MKFLLIAAFAILFIKQPLFSVKSGIRSKSFDTSRYAVLNVNDGDRLFALPKSISSGHLSTMEIEFIDSIINDEISIERKKSKYFPIHSAKQYYKQLIVGINDNGEKEIWVNCFCSVKDSPDWKSRIIYVLDGGACYFRLKINLNQKKPYDLEVNGVG